MGFNIRSVDDIIGSLLFEQLQEFSSAKKTCIMHIVNNSLQGYLTLKFGKPHSFYFKDDDISSYVLLQFLEQNIISQEVYLEIKGSCLSIEEYFEVLSLTVHSECIESFKEHFYKDLVCFMLLDKNSNCFHISQSELQNIITSQPYHCALQKFSGDMQSFGQFILDMYARMKEHDSLRAVGNAIRSKSGADVETLITKYNYSCIPLDTAIIAIPGLHLASLGYIKKALSSGEIEIIQANFENQEVELISEEKPVSKNEVRRLDVPKKINVTGLKVLSSSVTFFGLFSLSVLLIKLYLVLHELGQ